MLCEVNEMYEIIIIVTHKKPDINGTTKKGPVAAFLKRSYRFEKRSYRTISPIAAFFRPRFQMWPKPCD